MKRKKAKRTDYPLWYDILIGNLMVFCAFMFLIDLIIIVRKLT